MSSAAGIVVATGAITAANELLFSGGASKFNWRLLPATAGLAVALDLLQHLAPQFAVGLAWLCLATVMIVPFGNAPTPLQNITTGLGYAKKVT